MTEPSLKNYDFRGKARTQFLAVMPQVKESLAAGFTLRIIWRDLCARGIFDARYSQFAYYVNHYITKPAKPAASTNPKQVGQPALPRPTPVRPEMTPSRKEDEPKKRFNFTTIGKEYLMDPYKGEDDN